MVCIDLCSNLSWCCLVFDWHTKATVGCSPSKLSVKEYVVVHAIYSILPTYLYFQDVYTCGSCHTNGTNAMVRHKRKPARRWDQIKYWVMAIAMAPNATVVMQMQPSSIMQMDRAAAPLTALSVFLQLLHSDSRHYDACSYFSRITIDYWRLLYCVQPTYALLIK